MPIGGPGTSTGSTITSTTEDSAIELVELEDYQKIFDPYSSKVDTSSTIRIPIIREITEVTLTLEDFGNAYEYHAPAPSDSGVGSISTEYPGIKMIRYEYDNNRWRIVTLPEVTNLTRFEHNLSGSWKSEVLSKESNVWSGSPSWVLEGETGEKVYWKNQNYGGSGKPEGFLNGVSVRFRTDNNTGTPVYWPALDYRYTRLDDIIPRRKIVQSTEGTVLGWTQTIVADIDWIPRKSDTKVRIFLATTYNSRLKIESNINQVITRIWRRNIGADISTATLVKQQNQPLIGMPTGTGERNIQVEMAADFDFPSSNPQNFAFVAFISGNLDIGTPEAFNYFFEITEIL